MKWINPVLFFLILVIAGCTNPSDTQGIFVPDDLSRRDKMRYQQYLLEGKQLYKQHCSNCHQMDGKGLGELYPPLAGADYFLSDIQRAACIVKNGQKGEIQVNGIVYNMEMPGVNDLSPLEIAEILTYTANSWGNQTGFVTASDIRSYLRACY
jgi:mono/diheme cytochrome c family protein